MQATVYNLAGEEVEMVELDDAVFGIAPNMAVIHQAVLRQQANARQGTHETKTRADVSGGGRKPWRQKGTGRARQGSTRSPQWRHGGVVFGPHVRSYTQSMPRKMRHLAISGVLSAKVADGQLVLINSFEELEPRTKSVIELMKKLNIGENSALIMTAESESTIKKASSNLPKVNTLSAHLLSLVDMLKHTYLVMPRASLDIVNGILGGAPITSTAVAAPARTEAPAATEEETDTPVAAEPSAELSDEPSAEMAAPEMAAAIEEPAPTRAKRSKKAAATDLVEAEAPAESNADAAESETEEGNA